MLIAKNVKFRQLWRPCWLSGGGAGLRFGPTPGRDARCHPESAPVGRRPKNRFEQALGGMSVPGTPQSGTNAGAGKSATGSADRKALDQKVLRDLNPTKVTWSGYNLTWKPGV